MLDQNRTVGFSTQRNYAKIAFKDDNKESLILITWIAAGIVTFPLIISTITLFTWLQNT
jgi:hypothetical protein